MFCDKMNHRRTDMKEGARAKTCDPQDYCNAEIICIFGVAEKEKPSRNLLFGRIRSNIKHFRLEQSQKRKRKFWILLMFSKQHKALREAAV